MMPYTANQPGRPSITGFAPAVSLMPSSISNPLCTIRKFQIPYIQTFTTATGYFAQFDIYSDVWHVSGGNPIAAGLTFVVTVTKDGVPVDNLRSTFTLNIVDNNLT